MKTKVKSVRLKDVLPFEFFEEFEDSPANKHLNQIVVKEHNSGGWTGKHKNVINWWELDNGMLVGMKIQRLGGRSQL